MTIPSVEIRQIMNPTSSDLASGKIYEVYVNGSNFKTNLTLAQAEELCRDLEVATFLLQYGTKPEDINPVIAKSTKNPIAGKRSDQNREYAKEIIRAAERELTKQENSKSIKR